LDATADDYATTANTDAVTIPNAIIAKHLEKKIALNMYLLF